jgi:hypothetical protein
MSEAFDTADKVHRLAEPADPILTQWERFKPLFAEAMEDGFWTIEDLEQKIAHKRAFFFPGKAAAIITEIVSYPGGERAMHTLWACGDVDEVVQLAPGVEAIARMMGCTSMIVEGRAAWKKLLSPQGYAPWSVTLRKAL